MTGLDLLRFQSKVMFETIAPYSGVVNHLCNYVCGDKGATMRGLEVGQLNGLEVGALNGYSYDEESAYGGGAY